MKARYDGLQVVRIPVGSSDIFTFSTCLANIMNIMENNVCISETEADTSCSDYRYKRYDEYYSPGDTSAEDFTC